MRAIITFLILCTFVLSVPAQPVQLDMQVFEQRRAVFMAQMQPDAIAIFPGKPVYLRNNDVEYPYRQESNFYYLSGFEEPESLLLLDPSAPRYKYVMYVRKRDRRRETYDGPRAGLEGAMTTFNADTALYIDDFRRTVRTFIKYDRPIYYTFGINVEMDRIMQQEIVEKRSRGNFGIIDPAPLVNQMRLIKNDGDWRMGFRKAIDISAAGHIEAIKAIKPGLYEYEIQGVFEYVFRKHGSPRNGYPCIVGSGPNSTILHYNVNSRKMADGDMLLMDCGAEYGYYTADITRTVPVNGKFSREQRKIYEIVYRAQEAAMQMVKPGIEKSALDEKINDILGNGLRELGFIKNKNHYRMFSLHGYAHWLGIDVHDVGAYTKGGESVLLEPGMVFTIEPGLYVRPDVLDKMREQGYSEDEVEAIRKKIEKYMYIGVRIEDDILVTENGFENLSKAVPRTIEALEKLMAIAR